MKGLNSKNKILKLANPLMVVYTHAKMRPHAKIDNFTFKNNNIIIEGPI